ncbi:hypothetical protein ANN_20968 [Periplaneta americana]|uniref:Mos1 transposase HTH domain-containing protein n=1 Tax=Periplaneta americana TaxID=6978 RepID=A0ABQ8SEQ8_PERAM|nr:hypothetical protein ANN_20968 [Periplaneta americana]
MPPALSGEEQARIAARICLQMACLQELHISREAAGTSISGLQLDWGSVAPLDRWRLGLLLVLTVTVVPKSQLQEIAISNQYVTHSDGESCTLQNRDNYSSSDRSLNYATKMARILLSSICEEQRSFVRFLWAKGHNLSEIHRDMCGIYGEDCMNYSNISRWCAFFADSHENLCESPCSGRMVTAATQWNFRRGRWRDREREREGEGGERGVRWEGERGRREGERGRRRQGEERKREIK